MSESLLLLIRVVGSLTVIFALLWFLARRLNGSRLAGPGAAIRIVARQSLSRRSGLAVVEVDQHRLLLGVADTGVTLLTELPAAAESTAAVPASISLPEDAPSTTSASDALGVTAEGQASQQHWDRVLSEAQVRQDGPLAGSILAPTTWRRTLVALRGKQ